MTACSRAIETCGQCGRPQCRRCGRCKSRIPDVRGPNPYEHFCPSRLCCLIKWLTPGGSE